MGLEPVRGAKSPRFVYAEFGSPAGHGQLQRVRRVRFCGRRRRPKTCKPAPSQLCTSQKSGARPLGQAPQSAVAEYRRIVKMMGDGAFGRVRRRYRRCRMRDYHSMSHREPQQRSSGRGAHRTAHRGKSRRHFDHVEDIFGEEVNVAARLEGHAPHAAIGAPPEGRQELVGFQVGVRERAQSWRELLVEVKRRGLALRPGSGFVRICKRAKDVVLMVTVTDAPLMKSWRDDAETRPSLGRRGPRGTLDPGVDPTLVA
jgi:hypothetical protein